MSKTTKTVFVLTGLGLIATYFIAKSGASAGVNNTLATDVSNVETDVETEAPAVASGFWAELTSIWASIGL